MIRKSVLFLQIKWRMHGNLLFVLLCPSFVLIKSWKPLELGIYILCSYGNIYSLDAKSRLNLDGSWYQTFVLWSSLCVIISKFLSFLFLAWYLIWFYQCLNSHIKFRTLISELFTHYWYRRDTLLSFEIYSPLSFSASWLNINI